MLGTVLSASYDSFYSHVIFTTTLLVGIIVIHILCIMKLGHRELTKLGKGQIASK